MAFRLKNLRLRRVSLVDDPANEHATVTLFKAKGESMECPNGHEVMEGKKYCPDCGAEMKAKAKAAEPAKEDSMDVNKLQADLKAAEELLNEEQKKREAAEAKAAELQKKLDEFQNTPEAIEKRKLDALPAEIRKRLEDNEAELRKMREAHEDEVVIAKVKAEFGSLPGKHEDLAKVYRKAVAALDEKQVAELDKALKAGSDAIKLTFAEKGRGGEVGGANDAYAEIMAKVGELRKADSKLSEQDAIAKISNDNPELYGRYLKGARARA